MKFKNHAVWRWYAQKNLAAMQVELYLMGDGVHGEAYQKRFENESISTYAQGEVATSAPTMVMDYEEAQFLMDQLFDAGIKPKNMGPSQGQLQAMEDHIESLKKIIDGLMVMPGEATPVILDMSGKTVDLDQLASQKG